MSDSQSIAIVAASRTPIGAVGGTLAPLQAVELATIAIKAALKQGGLDPRWIQYTCMGWVAQDPRSTNLAKIAAERAGVPETSPATTLHENCASGGAAIHSICRRILLGEIEAGVAAGTESMSNVPRYLFQGRTSGRLYGDLALEDGLMGALVEREVGPKGELVGLMTERLVARYGVTRQAQDEVAFRSHANAWKAWEEGAFAGYVEPVEVPSRKEKVILARDEGPRKLDMDYFTRARPYFMPDGGTITSQNSSSINDAAAALVLMRADRAREMALPILGYLHGYWNVGVERAYMGEGAFKVIPPLLARTGFQIGDVDYFELNEAFAAVVASAFVYLPDLPVEKVNAWGSGISLGHPVGCTGVRQVVDMVHQLRRRGGHVGVTTRCVGGGIGSGEVVTVNE